MKKGSNAEIIADELDKFSAIESLYTTKGGELLFNSLMADAVGCIDTLTAKYASLSHLEFIALCADLKTKIDLARVLKKSVKNTIQARKDLEEALLEE